MNPVEYDLDISGGIMEQIQKLVAPPVSDDSSRRSKRKRTTEPRRQGKTVNRDCCDSCKEGGDLLCCDRCPAAFHLICHDPPLCDDELPPGEWLCHQCRVTANEGKDDDAESNSSNSSKRAKRPAGPDAAPGTEPSTSSAGVSEKDSDDSSGDRGILGGLEVLIKAASMMNPVQFELSRDIACTTPLPGSSKHVYGRKHKPPKKLAHELDNGMVPLPARLCHDCRKSCRIGPLIQCDYCPLLFHLDCLNPPLTCMPSGRWMCPNHVEHFIDENLVRTNSLTERVKLWDKSSGMVDQDAVKLNFLKHVHRTNPPFRVKRLLPPRKRVKVPGLVKALYKRPSAKFPLAPRASLSVPEPPAESKTSNEATPEEQEEWLAMLISFQLEMAKHMAQRQLRQEKAAAPGDSSKSSDASSSTAKPTAAVAPVVLRESDNAGSAAASSSASENGVENAGSTGDVVSKMGQDSVITVSEQSMPFSAHKPGTGAVSLLHGNLASSTSSKTGDAEILDVQKAKVEAAVRSRSNSADAASVIKVSWHGSDKSVNQAGTITASGQSGSHPVPSMVSGQPQAKNIVISTINTKAVVTKVLPGGNTGTSKVVLPPGVAARSVTGSSPTSILTPRLLVPNVSRLGMTSAQGQANQVPGAPGTQTKVISVSTSTSGSKTATVVSGPKGITSNFSCPPAIANLNATLQQWMEGTGEGVPDIDMNKMDKTLLQLLAWQRLQQLVPNTTSSGSSSSSPNITGKKGLLNGLLTPGDNEVRARAVLHSLNGKGSAYMPYRTLSLGTGVDMDVQLHQFGHCNFVSSKHAVIFYDETSRHFELLNYSEFGTTVDHVLFPCDFSDKTVTTAQPTKVVASVREIISEGKKAKQKKNEEEKDKDRRYVMSARSREPGRPCNCKASNLNFMASDGAGWEGTAVVHHGSFIKVGCLEFVFSIVDQATSDVLPSSHRTKTTEPMSLLKTHLKAAHNTLA